MKSGPNISELLEHNPQWDSQTSEVKEESTPEYFSHTPHLFLQPPSQNPLWIRRQLRRQALENENRDPQTLPFKSNKF